VDEADKATAGEPIPAVPPRRRWRRVLAKVLIGLAVLVLLAAGGGIVAFKALSHRYETSVHKQTLLDPNARSSPVQGGGIIQTSLRGPLNFVLLGSDARDTDPSNGQRSDTIIVVHVPASLDKAYFISIPRDLRVKIPADPTHDYRGGTGKINGAFNFGGGGEGGYQLLSKTLYQLMGIKFDGAAIINFDGFQNVVRQLGGVDMCIDEKTKSIHTGAVYLPGCRHLAPWQALDYVRQRETLPNGDYDRQRHQQQFLKAIFEEATSKGIATDPLRLDKIIRAVGSTLTVDTNGVSLEEMVYTLRNISSFTMTGIQVPSYPTMLNGYSYILPYPDATTLYQAIANDSLESWVTAHPSWVNKL
jgi:LCP family protein required for cell wall assembly